MQHEILAMDVKQLGRSFQVHSRPFEARVNLLLESASPRKKEHSAQIRQRKSSCWQASHSLGSSLRRDEDQEKQAALWTGLDILELVRVVAVRIRS